MEGKRCGIRVLMIGRATIRKKEREAYCPFLMPDAGNRFYSGCVNERCAWYVADRGECAVKVIATR